MLYYIIQSFFILIIIFLILLKMKKNILWSILLCIGLFPFVYIFLGAIHSYFYGSGLVGDEGGLDSALFVIYLYVLTLWYIYLPAFILFVISIIKLITNKKSVEKY